MEKTMLAETADQWRSWLSANHGTSDEIWLVFWKRHTGRLSIEYDDALDEALCFGWIDGLIKSIDEDSYMRRFSPRQKNSPWSPINRERALELLRTGRMTDAGMNAIKAARENGTWYTEPRRIDMPQELEDELDGNPAAALFFAELAPSYRKHYMGWVDEARRPETRRQRAREACSLLAKGMKLPMK